VRPQGAGGIIQFDEVFKYVYSPNVKEFLVEAERVTLHTLRHGGLNQQPVQQNRRPNTDANPKDIFALQFRTGIN
jgi:hypothetical protein